MAAYVNLRDDVAAAIRAHTPLRDHWRVGEIADAVVDSLIERWNEGDLPEMVNRARNQADS